METTNFINNNPSVSPIPPHKSVSHWLIAVLAIIAVVGYFVISYSLALWPFGDLSKPVPAPTPQSAVTDPTANWQIYTNTEYGFEVKYPEGWEVIKEIQELGSQAIEPMGEQAIITLQKINTTQKITIVPSSPLIKDVDSDANTTFAGLGAYQENHSDSFVIYITDNDLEKITNSAWSLRANEIEGRFSTEQDKNEELQILSTFKFIDDLDTSDWKTYRNEEYGFEFRYPGDWCLENDVYINLFSPEGCKKLTATPLSGSELGEGVSPDIVLAINYPQIPESKPENITISGNNYSYYSYFGYSDVQHEAYISIQGKNTFNFDVWQEAGKKYINQILSTFKFLE